MLPTLSLNNLYQYDNTLFDTAQMPSEDISRSLLVDTILREYGEMQVLTPDWSMLRYSINTWFESHSLQLARLWADYIATYDPLNNKDAHYTETRTPDIMRRRQRTDQIHDVESYDGSSSMNSVSNPGQVITESGSETNQYKGFNSSAFNDVSKTLPGKVTTASGSNSGSGSSSGSSSTERTGVTSSGETEKESGSETITRREWGNVGVTMASQLLRDSVSFHRTFNWYDLAAKLWAVDNLVMIY